LEIIFYFSHCFSFFSSFSFLFRVVSLEICFIGFLFWVSWPEGRGRERDREKANREEKLLVKNCHFRNVWTTKGKSMQGWKVDLFIGDVGTWGLEEEEEGIAWQNFW
jgi:cbb3-type cytochrome oxidase subunit 3